METTPPGRGGISVVEVVGRGGWQAIKDLIAGRTFSKPPRMALVNLADGNDHIDEAILAFVPASESLNGAETVEVNLHGGPLCVKRLTAALKKRGIPLRGIRHFCDSLARSGRLDTLQLDALRLLPRSTTLRAAAMLTAQQHGALSREVSEIAATLRSARRPRDRARLREAAARLEQLIDSAPHGVALAAPQLCVIAGEPNTGKSSLFNALLGRQRAIVHPEVGTTRDFIEAITSCNGVPFKLVDTAGIYAQPTSTCSKPDDIQATATRQARSVLKRARVVLWVVDAYTLQHARSDSRTAAAQGASLSPLHGATRNRRGGTQSVVLALNKIDMLSPRKLPFPPALPESLRSEPVVQVPTSALTGEGVETLRECIVWGLLGTTELLPVDSPHVFVRSQLRSLLQTRRAVAAAEAGWETEFLRSRRLLTAAVKPLQRLQSRMPIA
jgi:tRNA modification GTPase